MIQKRGRKYILRSVSTGRILGTHPSRAAAERQERAIYASKARAAAKRNPSRAATVRAAELRTGDTIELEDLGREHIIQGPFRSGRGIKFEDQHGNYVLLHPNETVRLVARENPSRQRRNPADTKSAKRLATAARAASNKANLTHLPGDHVAASEAHTRAAGAYWTLGDRKAEEAHNYLALWHGRASRGAAVGSRKSPGASWTDADDYTGGLPVETVRGGLRRENPASTNADQLRLEIADALLTMRATNHRLRIQDSPRGALFATNVDTYRLASHPADLRKLTRIAALRDYSLQVCRGAILLMPL